MNKFVYMVSLGCAKNLVDTELAAGSMAVKGIGFADDMDDADVYFINTCAFISPARDEAEQFIKDAVKWKQLGDNRKIIVGGCLTQWDEQKEFRGKYSSIDLWIPVDEAKNLDKHIVSLYENETRITPSVSTPKYLYDENTPRLQLTAPHFAYLKIADGCDNNCSYCAIPGIRGSMRNRSVASVVKEARNLIGNGVKELVLTAQDTTAFKDSDTGENLSDLIKKLDAVEGYFSLRLLYAHPAHLTDEHIELFGSCKHLLPYIDLPLQHISNPILKSMNRKIDSCEIRRKIAKLREVCPEIAIRTTFLLGYPGETEEDFEKVCSFVEEIEFTRLGVFPYCLEERTPAADLPDHVPTEIAQERCDKLMQIQSEISLAKNKGLVGKDIEVMVDYLLDDVAVGRTYMDAYEIDNIVEIEISEDNLPTEGEWIKVKITDATEFDLKGCMG